jgi:hypothetical protein
MDATRIKILSFGYIVKSLIFPDRFELKEPLRALMVAILGMGVSVVAGYVSLLYGGYANRNWEKADQIADSREWKDLLPSNQKTSGCGLNAIAKRLARPCKPKKELSLVFIIYLGLAALLLALHLAIFFWAYRLC